MKRVFWIALLSIGAASVVTAQGAKDSFKARWERLTMNPEKVFKVSARPGEEIPEATLNLSFGPGSMVSVSRGKAESAKDLLEDEDIAGVVNRNLRTVKFCYCNALKKDPEFEGEAIVELQIKTSGKVSKVEIEPGEIADHTFGKCLAPRVATWSFPKFTGKKDEGVQLQSIGYEFPLSFSRAAEE